MNNYSDGKWTLYCHINKINKKKYIGITSKKYPNSRWRNGLGYVDTPHFSRAIAKYGWDNFEHIILSSKLTKEEACDLEIFLIKELKLQDDRFGYNVGDGGNTGNSMRGEYHPMYGKHHTQASKEKNRIAHLGKKGKKMSDEVKMKISIANKGRPKAKGTKVRCVETGKIYITAGAAARDTNSDASSILKCVHGKLTHTHGLHWEAA